MINQNLTSAEVIAALIEEVRAIAADPHRGEQFSPLLSDDKLATATHRTASPQQLNW